jgi:tetratricopeptide (TPR) repeat protein
MTKSPAQMLNELDEIERRSRSRKLLYTALPLLVIFGVYALMANAVAAQSRELEDTKAEIQKQQTLLDRKRGDLKAAEADLVAVQERRQKLEVDLASARDAMAELTSKNDEVVNALTASGSAASKVEKVEAVLLPQSSPHARAVVLWKQGYAAYNAGNATQAKQLYEQARQADPKYAPAANSLGRLAYEGGDVDNAKKLYSEALAGDPTYAPALHNLALIAKRKGDLPEASRLTEQALQARPGYAPAVTLKSDLQVAELRKN